LTFSMLLALARKIPQAHASMKAAEWNRKAFQGVELYNKTLGILGMGRIGTEVARRAMAFGMQVLAYDPYLSLARAKALQVELIENLDDIFARSDFLSVHMPMTDETRGMINAAAFAKMKKGVRVLNCARGGIVNEKDLYDAIQSGQVAGAALDVYETEPLPQEFPLRDLPLVITYGGRATEMPGDPISRAVLKGFLESVGGKEVNQVNVRALASSLGLLVDEIKSNEETDFNEWLHVAVYSNGNKASVGGTFF